jgi:adenylate cyclase
MADIFISYSKATAAQTEQLAKELQAKGFTVWYDTSLIPGDSFRDVIVSELAQARAAIVIWDAASVKSEWVCSEASRARARRILIPVRVDDVRSHDIPPPFDSLHTELLSNRAAIETALAKLGVTSTLAAKDASSAPTAPAGDAARPALPSKPPIAVLPFQNMSGDPEQEYFADGITEDILTELSRFRELFVISRNSVFVYKGKPINVQTVAKDLGVQYVVEGSVRKAGNRVRITVQLIDAETDAHLWAERYDRELADIFAIQDEVTSSIVAILPGRVADAAHERVQRKPPENLAAYECVLAGKRLHHRTSRADNAEALRMLERAIALDGSYAHAHAWKACTLGQSFVHGWSADPAATMQALVGELALALSLDENDSDVHRVLAGVNMAIHRDHDKALYHQERALVLNPNDDLVVVQHGELLTWIGQAEQGIEWIQKAMRLNPYHPERFWGHLGRAYFVARRYDEAIKAFQRISRDDHVHWAYLAACQAELGEATAATCAAQEVQQRAPDFSIARFVAMQHYKHKSDREHLRAALVKAQLPA